jgi:RNA polymerase subunit RPABC4/transcription elongation factor Spt4
MYNEQKYCPSCEWHVQYDKEGIGLFSSKRKDIKYCPKCGTPVITKPWSPNL